MGAPSNLAKFPPLVDPKAELVKTMSVQLLKTMAPGYLLSCFSFVALLFFVACYIGSFLLSAILHPLFIYLAPLFIFFVACYNGSFIFFIKNSSPPGRDILSLWWHLQLATHVPYPDHIYSMLFKLRMSKHSFFRSYELTLE